jgi:Pyruvate/2-oxoacid:ferredoxin oxidoreductase gamma subunit
MLIKTIFAGFGGQGVLSMGLNLAQAAMLEGRYVTYLPAYGARVRGGTANCTISVSDEEIASRWHRVAQLYRGHEPSVHDPVSEPLQTGGIFS